ncbi:MAG: RNA methyltransferase substrate-binding domain-containing protein, partial [Deltaproteobacteria bacterium]
MRIIYGINPLMEALKSHPEYFKDMLIAHGRAGSEVEKIIKLAGQHNIKYRTVQKAEIEGLTGTSHHQGVAAILSEFKYADVEDVLEKWRASKEK